MKENQTNQNIIIEEGSLSILRLTEEETGPAIQLAAMTYHACLEPSVRDPQMNRFFYEYLNPERLKDQVRGGSLYLWGACLQKKLLGVAALSNTGQITMFYVHPDYQGQGIGEKLLAAVTDFAPELYLSRLTLNAAPGWTGSWFGYEGFSSIRGTFDRRAAFNPMEMKLSGVRNYPARSIPEGKILIAVLAVLGLSTLLAAGYSILFIL